MGVDFQIKKPNYQMAVAWIGTFDEPDSGDGLEQIAEYRTCYMVADLFGVDRQKLGADVYNFRAKKGLVK
jgi:hypothetical protein